VDKAIGVTVREQDKTVAAAAVIAWSSADWSASVALIAMGSGEARHLE